MLSKVHVKTFSTSNQTTANIWTRK